MTINEMFDELENKERDTYIVTLKYKYDFEEKYTIENHILEYESITDSYVWLDDWYEGQTDIEVLGYMLLGDVDTTKLLTCEDCISKDLPSVTPSYNSIKTELKPCDTPRTNLAETSQDCISRKAVNKLKKYRFSYDTNTTIPKSDVFVKISDITNLPSVNTPRPEGKWIHNNCSICNYNVNPWNNTPYCPNCGAKMNGGGEDGRKSTD
jgi:hypothetical protein